MYGKLLVPGAKYIFRHKIPVEYIGWTGTRHLFRNLDTGETFERRAARGLHRSEEDLYPQHTNLAQVKRESQAIGEFLDWLSHTKHIHLSEYPDQRDGLVPVVTPVEKLLAEFFNIDLKALEKEKLAMLDGVRRLNGGANAEC